MFFQKFSLFHKFQFLVPEAKDKEKFSFSTELDNIGIKNDVSIGNGTYVDVISDPITINRAKYGGDISVTKIRADVATDYHTIIKEFWVPTNLIVNLESNPSQPSN